MSIYIYSKPFVFIDFWETGQTVSDSKLDRIWLVSEMSSRVWFEPGSIFFFYLSPSLARMCSVHFLYDMALKAWLHYAFSACVFCEFAWFAEYRSRKKRNYVFVICFSYKLLININVLLIFYINIKEVYLIITLFLERYYAKPANTQKTHAENA